MGEIAKITDQVGGLYDLTPSSVNSNVYCLDNPDEQVLGYFSVSSSTSKRLFIKENFAGIFTPYTDRVCISDTIFSPAQVPSLNVYSWVIIEHLLQPPQYRVITRTKGCYDCTVRGTDTPPDFWNSNK